MIEAKPKAGSSRYETLIYPPTLEVRNNYAKFVILELKKDT